MREIAKRMMASATRGNTAEADQRAAFRTTDTLSPHLSMLMGRGGFQALLARALLLASAEVHWLAAVQVVADGELEGLSAARSKLDAAEFSDGEVALLAQLLGLLVAFIGPALTIRLITQILPQVSFDDADFGEAAEQ